MCPEIKDLVAKIVPEIRSLRRDLHRHPELAYQEYRTSATVVERLKALSGWKVRTGLAETGVIATLGENKTGPAVAIRADMDALPIQETSGVEYASQVPGVMHACGHDGHTAMLLGVASVLSDIQSTLEGPVRLIFQPAEEGGAGGRRMTEEGALDDPQIAAVFGLHNMPMATTQAGQICLCTGAAMAATASFDLIVTGKGGHAAMPHVTVDPIVIGSQIITTLQAIVSRRIDPIQSAVLSFTKFQAGTAYNVIPEKATLSGTIRSLDDAVMSTLCSLLREQSERIAEAYGAVAEVRIYDGYPVVKNHPKTDNILRTVLSETGRAQDLVDVPPMMGGEDFAFYQQRVPGTFWFLAARPSGLQDVPFCHHPSYDFNDDILADGILLHVELARRFARLWVSGLLSRGGVA